jgi:2'-5' RNA ligase
VWLGLEGETKGLIDLEKRIRTETASFGQAPEDREFHPHLTLARVKEAGRRDRQELSELIEEGCVIEAPEWRISELELIRSELKPGGSVYTTLVSYPFGV